MKFIRSIYSYSIVGIIMVLQFACKDPIPPPITSDPFPTVKICNQTWMLKNLEVDKYRNGDPIPQVTDNAQWATLTTGAWCYLRNDSANGAIYGKLYNWYAVNDPRGLAPAGWHVPSVAEYRVLETCLGGGPVAGDKLKEAGTTHWWGNNGATNSSGFTALPGERRSDHNGWFYTVNEGCWWTSTQFDSDWSWFHNLFGSMSNSYVDYFGKGAGFSVRCVKD